MIESMQIGASRRYSPRRIAWLLLLALLLPLAQVFASIHLLSHVRVVQTALPGSHASLGVDHCDMCLTAAALTTGAPLVQSFAAALGVLPRAAVSLPASASFFAVAEKAYESRAPPPLQV